MRKPRRFGELPFFFEGGEFAPCLAGYQGVIRTECATKVLGEIRKGNIRGPNCAGDGGRSPGFGLQDQNPNHQLLLSLNGLGSEQVWKRRGLPVRYVLERRTNLNRCRGVESIGMSSKPGSFVIPGTKFGGNLITAQTVTGI